MSGNAETKKYLVPIDLNRNELQNALMQKLASAPNWEDAMLYYNTTSNKFCFHENGEFVTYVTPADIEDLDPLPDQTGHSGQFLTTDGEDASWIALPYASENTAGAIKVGNNLTIDENGVLSAVSEESAVQSVNGETGAVIVKAIKNAATNTNDMLKIWLGTQAEYDALQTKEANTLYYVKDTNNAVDLPALLAAKQNKLNQGTNISLTPQQDGSVTIASTYSYTLPTASNETLGGIKVGTNLNIENGVLSTAANVASVNNKTGVVTLDKTDIGLENVDNTSDLDKPISTATQDALDNKADAATTIAGYGITDAYTKTEIDAKISAVYKPAGNITFAQLPTLSSDVLGNVYNITDAFTTTADFVEGAGNSYPANTNVGIVNIGTTDTPVYKFDVFSGFVDLSNYLTTTDAANTYLSQTDATTNYLSKTDAASTYATTSNLNTLEAKTVQKLVAANDILTPVNGRCTWEITHTFGDDVQVTVKEVATGEEVEPGIIQSNNKVIIKINSANTISAGTYKAIVTGVVQPVSDESPIPEAN